MLKQKNKAKIHLKFLRKFKSKTKRQLILIELTLGYFIS